MKLIRASFENFRNIASAVVEPRGKSLFFEGSNGHGKSNLREAIGLVTAFRSFRTTDIPVMIRDEEPRCRVALRLAMDSGHVFNAELTISREGGKAVSVEGHTIPSLQDFIGRFPSVVLSEDDIQLLRGSPTLRRRSMDLFLSSLDSSYLEGLRAYHTALRERNALLRNRPLTALLRPFEWEMARHGAAVARKRAAISESLEAALIERYSAISQSPEAPGLRIGSREAFCDEEAFAALLETNRERDIQQASTRQGPHRDDFIFSLLGRPARDYASDGQQRNLVLAFRLAQFALIREARNETPLLLADDILGSLDARRRQAFWQLVHPSAQIVATGTSFPEGSDLHWARYRVATGSVFAEES